MQYRIHLKNDSDGYYEENFKMMSKKRVFNNFCCCFYNIDKLYCQCVSTVMYNNVCMSVCVCKCVYVNQVNFSVNV